MILPRFAPHRPQSSPSQPPRIISTFDALFIRNNPYRLAGTPDQSNLLLLSNWHRSSIIGGSKTIEPFDGVPQAASLDYSGSMILRFAIACQFSRSRDAAG